MEQSLEALVKRAQNNDEEAFEILFRDYYSSVYKAAIKLCRNDADAQDIAQLTFLQVKKSIQTLEKPEYFPYWINRICVNKCKNLFRSNHMDLYDNEYYNLFNQFIDQNREHNSLNYSHYQCDMEKLKELLDSLKPEYREVFELTYFSQLNNEETAELLDIPVGTVKSRLSYAKKQLRDKIERYERLEQTKLDFHSDVVTSGVVSTAAATTLSKLKSIKGLIQNAFVFGGASLVKLTVFVLLGITTIAGGAYAIQAIQNQNEQDSIQTMQTSPQTQIKQKELTFTTIEIKNYQITNARDGYYLLRGMAYSKEALKTKSEDDLKAMMPLYQEVKKQGGSMFELLQRDGWSTQFEILTESF